MQWKHFIYKHIKTESTEDKEVREKETTHTRNCKRNSKKEDVLKAKSYEVGKGRSRNKNIKWTDSRASVIHRSNANVDSVWTPETADK